MRLGEVLISQGLIDQSQLKVALEAQLVYGGHLGTNLVELGFVDLESLGATLSDEFKIRQVQQKMIEEVAPDVLKRIPAKLIERHRVIPFEYENRTLHVAMVDPRNLQALDELSFASGSKIEAWVAPELLVLSAMDRHYGIRREMRHIPVSGKARSKPRVAPAPKGSAEPPVAAMPAPREVAPKPRRTEFVPQPSRPSRGLGGSPQAGDVAFTIEWIKKASESGPGLWSELFGVDLNHEHFDDLEGVFVIWHQGQNPVLHVGCGHIRTELTAMRRHSEVIAVFQESDVYVTWASAPPERAHGAARYLVSVLTPQIAANLREVEPIVVDLPC